MTFILKPKFTTKNKLDPYDPDGIPLQGKWYVGKLITKSSVGAKRAANAFAPLLLQFQASHYPVLRCGIGGLQNSGKTRFAKGLLANFQQNHIGGMGCYSEYKAESSLLIRHYDAARIHHYSDYGPPQDLVDQFEAEARPRIDIVEHPHWDVSKDKSLQMLWTFKTIPEDRRLIECYTTPDLAKTPGIINFFKNVDDLLLEGA